MTLVFTLYKYFPYGGLQRDMLAIAQACTALGLTVKIVCAEWQGDKPEAISVAILPTQGCSNHARNRLFAQKLQAYLRQDKPALVVGFNKMQGLDIYYAADTCFKAKLQQERWPLLTFLPRYRQFLADEAAVFGADSRTKILAISARSVEEYEHYYPHIKSRCTLLPPGINRNRKAGNDAADIRAAFRRDWCLTQEQRLLLMVGSGFRTKGVDRALHALAALPTALLQRSRMIVIGQDKAAPFMRLAKKLGVSERVLFLAGRNDIPHFLLGADVLLHPARRENTGTVLLEAAVAALPVLATAVCGYSHYIAEHNLGLVTPEPFQQRALNGQLAHMLSDDAQRAAWAKNALDFASRADIYSLHQRAAECIARAAASAAL